jgi:beta-galactosidase
VTAIGPVLAHVRKIAGVQPGPQTPEGVYARVVDGRTLYVNTTGDEKKIPVAGTRKGIITHRVYSGTVTLGPQDADLIE